MPDKFNPDQPSGPAAPEGQSDKPKVPWSSHGNPQTPMYSAPHPPNGYYGTPVYGTVAHPRPTQSGLYLAAAIINWVTLGIIILVTCGFGIIAAAWFVPMTVFIHRGVTDGRKHTALAVCTLLFCNFIGGTLMLVDDVDRPAA